MMVEVLSQGEKNAQFQTKMVKIYTLFNRPKLLKNHFCGTVHTPYLYRAFALVSLAAMQIYLNKRKCLHKKS